MSNHRQTATPSLILTTAIRYLLPLLFLFSIFVLFRGHNEPGGGFVGGLVAASAFSLYDIGFGVTAARRLLRVHPIAFIAVGLLLAALSGLAPVFYAGDIFLDSIWTEITIPVLGKLGTPGIFDIGVYFAVIGVVTLIVFTLSEEQ